MIYLIYCKNLFKGHNVSPPSITIKGKKVTIIYIGEKTASSIIVLGNWRSTNKGLKLDPNL
jgi:hypothetical protein